MKILALDSSGASASACITDGERLISLFTAASQQKHSCTLLPMTEQVLMTAGLDISDIDAFAVNEGPGSFTGVRIGISLIKGLAFGTEKPVLGVSSLEAQAYNLDGYDGIVCPVMDARRSQFYNALFKDGKRLTPDRLITATELQEELEGYALPVYFVGDGTAIATELIKSGLVRSVPHAQTVSSAYGTAVCAYRNYLEGKGIYTDEALQPVYLRMSQAERERKEREAAENG